MHLVTADKVDVKTYNLTSRQGPFTNLGNALPVGRFFGNCPLGAFLQLLPKQLVLATDRDKKPARKQLICPQMTTSVGVLPVPLVPDCSQGKPGADVLGFTGGCSLAAGAEAALGRELWRGCNDQTVQGACFVLRVKAGGHQLLGDPPQQFPPRWL